MLNFLLVLGQIPGTNIEISFTGMLVVYLLLLLIYIRLRKPYLLKEVATAAWLLYLKARYLYFRSRIMYL